MRRALLIVCAVIAAGCLRIGSPIEPTVALGTPFDLKVGATAVAPGGLTVRFEAVNSDSRCPINATCVWAGEALVAMFVSVEGKRSTLEMSTSGTRSQLAFRDFEIQLTSLQPFPFAGFPTAPADYVATLQVTKR